MGLMCLCRVIDMLIDRGSRIISLSPNQYRTFCRVVYGEVLNHPVDRMYRGCLITTWTINTCVHGAV